MRNRLAMAVTLALTLVGCGGDSGSKLAGGQTGENESKSSVVQNTEPATTPTTVAITTTVAARKPVEILKSGFTQLAPNSIGTSYVSYAAIVRNPNPDTWLASRVDVNFTFTDNAGTVVKSNSESFAAILPGQTVAIGDNTQAQGATKLDVKVLVGRWDNNAAQTTLGTFTAEGVTTTAQRFGGQKTNATVKSSLVKDLKSTKGVAVYYDSAGAIIGGAFTFIDFIPGGGSVGVEITGSSTVPNVAKTEVYVAITNLSLAPP